jgi:hypothetical protein
MKPRPAAARSVGDVLLQYAPQQRAVLADREADREDELVGGRSV